MGPTGPNIHGVFWSVLYPQRALIDFACKGSGVRVPLISTTFAPHPARGCGAFFSASGFPSLIDHFFFGELRVRNAKTRAKLGYRTGVSMVIGLAEMGTPR
jgi:hypothetical protein